MMMLFAAFIILFLDRITKLWIANSFSPGESVPVVEGIFHCTYVVNRGAAFGILEGSRWLFIAIGIVVLAGCCYFRREIMSEDIFIQWGMVCFVSGALGNLLDRIFLAGVIDFIDLRIWPVFNVADMAVCLGAGLIIGSMVWKQES